MAKRNDDMYLYKGYIIKTKFRTLNGGGYSIYKATHGKWFLLRDRRWNFMLPSEIVQKATECIDAFDSQLTEKFKKMFIEFCEKVAAKPGNYSEPIDADYFVRMNKKVKEINIVIGNYKLT
jgi:hypothetical protein